MSFHHPSIWWLLALLLVPLIWWRWLAPRRRAALRFSSLEHARAAGRTLAVRLRWLVPVLRTLAVVVLVICLARPQQVDEESRIFTEGVAIELVLDRSGSMRAEDFRIGSAEANRLEAAKQVVRQFITGGGRLAGRPNDLIGLIAFARYADSRCPLTLDHDHLIETVREVRFVTDREEDGTAIGDAIGLAIERLHGLERRREHGTSTITSKLIILLTDGESNVGDLDPLTAANMAAALGIRVYTIGAGTEASHARVPVDVGGRTFYQQVPVSLDEKTLGEIARTTGGEYFRATDTDSLEAIYARIDELERSEIEQRHYTDIRALAVEPVQLGGLTLPPLLVIVLVLVAAELVLASTRLGVGP